jgi:predicted transcriptional regulator
MPRTKVSSRLLTNKTCLIQVRLDRDDHHSLKSIARHERRTMSAVIRDAIEVYSVKVTTGKR